MIRNLDMSLQHIKTLASHLFDEYTQIYIFHFKAKNGNSYLVIMGFKNEQKL